MKHFLILLMALSLITSCKNDKKEKSNGYDRKERDDYRAQEGKDDETNTDEKSTKTTDYTESEGWSAADIRKMNQECLKSVDNNEEVANAFCPCVIEKLQKKYSSYDDLNTRGTEAEGKRIGEECKALIEGNTGDNDRVTTRGNWSAAEVKAFVGPCVTSAVNGGMTRSTATNYCECMKDKFEQLFPNAVDAGRVTEADLQTPSMKRLIQSCLEN